MRKLLLLAATAMLSLSVAKADLTFELSFEFSGAQTPGGTPPFVVLNFADTDTDEVTLTISTPGLIGSEFVSQVYFNSIIDSTDLTIDYASGQEASSVVQNPDGEKADGDGFFDVLFNYANPNRLDAGESSVYIITATGLTAANFDSLSVNSATGYPAAAHVQGIGEDGQGSGWITVPEIPGLHAALLLALPIGLAAVRRFRAKRA
jgi:hypothetical protein